MSKSETLSWRLAHPTSMAVRIAHNLLMPFGQRDCLEVSFISSRTGFRMCFESTGPRYVECLFT
jgi:hypothetical protein